MKLVPSGVGRVAWGPQGRLMTILTRLFFVCLYRFVLPYLVEQQRVVCSTQSRGCNRDRPEARQKVPLPCTDSVIQHTLYNNSINSIMDSMQTFSYLISVAVWSCSKPSNSMQTCSYTSSALQPKSCSIPSAVNGLRIVAGHHVVCNVLTSCTNAGNWFEICCQPSCCQ